MKLSLSLVFAGLAGLATQISGIHGLARIQVGNKLPAVNLHYGFPPTVINTAPYLAGKNVLIVGLPGAFTPT